MRRFSRPWGEREHLLQFAVGYELMGFFDRVHFLDRHVQFHAQPGQIPVRFIRLTGWDGYRSIPLQDGGTNLVHLL